MVGRRAKGALKFPVTAQIVVVAVVGIVANLVTGTVALSSLNHQQAQTDEIVAKSAVVSTALTQVNNALWTVRTSSSIVGSFPVEMRPDRVATAVEASENFEVVLADFEALHTAELGVAPAGIEQLRESWTQYKTNSQQNLFPLLLEDDLMGFAVSAKETTDLGTSLVESIDSFSAAVQAELDSRVEANKSAAAQSQALVAIFIAVGAVSAIGIAIFVSRHIARATRSVNSALLAMSHGDFTVSAKVTSRDELGEMALALGHTQDSLREILGSVIESADGVAQAAEALAQANGTVEERSKDTSREALSVADAASEISRSVATVAAGADQMGASIKEIAHNAGEAARVANKATEVASATNEKVSKLGESSEQIGNVVKVIKGIAEQTNLLALNATIEAARAGEAGKGFAVVAGEVKDLAQETAKATEDISHRVEAIQADTNAAIEAIQEIGEIVEQINAYQLTISSAVEEQEATTHEMGRGVNEAAHGSSTIAEQISSVARSAMDASQILTSVGSSISNLSGLSVELKQRVDKFQY